MAPPSRFRPWEDADQDDAPQGSPDESVKSSQVQSLGRPQYQTRSVSSSSYHHPPALHNEVRPDSTLASNLETTIYAPTSAIPANKRSFAATRSSDYEDQTPRKRSLKTLKAKPPLPHSATTDSNLSLSGEEVLNRYDGPRIRNASVACLQCRAKRRKV